MALKVSNKNRKKIVEQNQEISSGNLIEEFISFYLLQYRETIFLSLFILFIIFFL